MRVPRSLKMILEQTSSRSVNRLWNLTEIRVAIFRSLDHQFTELTLEDLFPDRLISPNVHTLPLVLWPWRDLEMRLVS
jgi:hypothetical protein